MNKAHLIDAVARKLDVPTAQAGAAVDAVLDAMVRAVVMGERVSVTGFGSFEKLQRPARTARNPQTGGQVSVPSRHVVKFRAGQNFKDLVAGEKKLKKRGSAIQKAPKGSKTSA